MSVKKFTFHYSGTVSLDVDSIWPDGDGPKNPTAEDVAKVVEECGGCATIIRDWSLEGDVSLTITDGAARAECEGR